MKNILTFGKMGGGDFEYFKIYPFYRMLTYNTNGMGIDVVSQLKECVT